MCAYLNWTWGMWYQLLVVAGQILWPCCSCCWKPNQWLEIPVFNHDQLKNYLLIEYQSVCKIIDHVNHTLSIWNRPTLEKRLCFQQCIKSGGKKKQYRVWDKDNCTVVQIPQCTRDQYPTMPHFISEMCTRVHISVTKWCIVEYICLWCIVGFVRWLTSMLSAEFSDFENE